jgi:hypothetical protein
VASSGNGARARLAEVAEEFAAGRATPHDLHEAFLSATVFCEAGEQPGFVAVGPPGDGFIPVFSSEGELARARGPVKWFSATGADLFGLIPDGYDLILDIAGPAPLRLSPSAPERPHQVGGRADGPLHRPAEAEPPLRSRPRRRRRPQDPRDEVAPTPERSRPAAPKGPNPW